MIVHCFIGWSSTSAVHPACTPGVRLCVCPLSVMSVMGSPA